MKYDCKSDRQLLVTNRFSTSWSACFCSRDLTETETDASELSDRHMFTIGNLKKNTWR